MPWFVSYCQGLIPSCSATLDSENLSNLSKYKNMKWISEYLVNTRCFVNYHFSSSFWINFSEIGVSCGDLFEDVGSHFPIFPGGIFMVTLYPLFSSFIQE